MKKPRISGDHVPIYAPAPDRFPGPDSRCFRAGQRYEHWIPNDHCFAKGPDGRWHLWGITHPAPPDFQPPDRYNPQTIHDGEWQLFHASTAAVSLPQAMQPKAFKDEAKILAPACRPGENRDIYAPHVVWHEGQWFMFYGPGPIRLATSEDLVTWQPQGPCFGGPESSRDPHLLKRGDECILTYVADQELWQRTSRDLEHWSPPKVIFAAPESQVPESPSLVSFEGRYYLFWCLWDGKNGPYDDRTFVFCADTPDGFLGQEPIATLAAHAPEILCDDRGRWYISSAERPHRGISLARLSWSD